MVHGAVVSTLSCKFAGLLLNEMDNGQPVEHIARSGSKLYVHSVLVPRMSSKVLEILIDCAYRGYLGLSLNDNSSEEDI